MKHRSAIAATASILLLLTSPRLPGQGSQEAGSSDEQLKLVENLVKILKAPNTSLDSRKAAAESLLGVSKKSTDASEQVMKILADASDRLAQLAVVKALAEQDDPDPRYKPPLLDLLLAGEPDLRAASAAALSRYRDGELIAQLGQIASASDGPLGQRLAAIQALGKMRSKAAVELLINLLNATEKDHGVSKAVKLACARGLSQLTLVDYGINVSAWQAWWEKNQAKTEEQWLRAQLDILAGDNRLLKDRLAQTEKALIEAVVQLFRTTPKDDAQRLKIIQGYLASDLPAHRRAALQILMELTAQNAELPADLLPAVRALLADDDWTTRQQCAQVLREAKDRQALPQILDQLEKENEPAVKKELLIALGQLGTPESLKTMIPQLKLPLDGVVIGAAQGIGRIFQNNPVPVELTDTVVAAFLERYHQANSDPLLKQELLAQMVIIKDPRFLPVLVDALAGPEADLRLFAAQGLAAFGDPKMVDVLLNRLSVESERGVRAAIATSVASLTVEAKVADVLVGRLNPAVESDKEVRNATFTAILRMIKDWPVENQVQWTEQVFARGNWIDEGHRKALTDALDAKIGQQVTGFKIDQQVDILKRFGVLMLKASRPGDAIKAFRQMLLAAKREPNLPLEPLGNEIAELILSDTNGQVSPVTAAQFLNSVVDALAKEQIESLTEKFVAALGRQGTEKVLRQFVAGLSKEFLQSVSQALREKLTALGQGKPATQPASPPTTEPAK